MKQANGSNIYFTYILVIIGVAFVVFGSRYHVSSSLYGAVVVDRFTGNVKYCEYRGRDIKPICSPWSDGIAENRRALNLRILQEKTVKSAFLRKEKLAAWLKIPANQKKYSECKKQEAFAASRARLAKTADEIFDSFLLVIDCDQMLLAKETN